MKELKTAFAIVMFLVWAVAFYNYQFTNSKEVEMQMIISLAASSIALSILLS
jgi:hypothetical protein